MSLMYPNIYQYLLPAVQQLVFHVFGEMSALGFPSKISIFIFWGIPEHVLWGTKLSLVYRRPVSKVNDAVHACFPLSMHLLYEGLGMDVAVPGLDQVWPEELLGPIY